MTTPQHPAGLRQAKVALREPLRSLGFTEDGSHWLLRRPGLQHSVALSAVRRLAGFVDLMHQVQVDGESDAALTETLASHGHQSPYPVIWAADRIDPRLLLEQVGAIVDGFQTPADVQQHREQGAEAAAQAVLQLGREILAPHFMLAPDNDDFALWLTREADGDGLYHCVYLEANASGTLATLVHCALPTDAVTRGFGHHDTRRQLMRAQRQVLFAHGRPLLLPLRRPLPEPAAQIAATLQARLRDRTDPQSG